MNVPIAMSGTGPWPVPCPRGESPASWIVYQGAGFRLGVVRCPPQHPRWARVNDIPGDPVLIVPQTPVRIEPLDGRGGVVDAGTAIFLDAGAQYRRACMVELGDRSHWFAFEPWVLEPLVPSCGSSRGKARLPLRFRVEAADYALQRQAFRHALATP